MIPKEIVARAMDLQAAPRTPLERVAACADVDPATGQALQQLQARLDPFGLRRRATPAAKVTTGTT